MHARGAHDVAALLGAQERAQRRARAKERAAQIDGDDAIEVLHARLVRRRGLLDARVVDEHVERPELALGVIE